MKKLIAFYKLGRPLNAVNGALTVLLGGLMAATGQWGNVFAAAIITFLVTASGNAWNDCLDVEIDRINQPQRIIPSGRLSQREAWLFALILSALSLIIASFINYQSFILVLACNILLYLYSWRLKSTVLLGNATVAIISAISVVFGGMAAGNVWPSLSLAVVIGTIIFAREILKTMADYEGDYAQKVRTVSTVWGLKPATILYWILGSVGLLLILLPFFVTPSIHWIYLLIIVVGIYPVMIYVQTQVRPSAHPQHLERMSRLLKYDFLVWFMAVFIGRVAG